MNLEAVGIRAREKWASESRTGQGRGGGEAESKGRGIEMRAWEGCAGRGRGAAA